MSIQFPKSTPPLPNLRPNNAPELSFSPEITQNAQQGLENLPFEVSGAPQDSTRLQFAELTNASSQPTELRFPEMMGGQVMSDAVNSFLNMGTPVGNDYTDLILEHPGNKATPAEARQISESIQEASEAYNIDPQLLLATLAHESQFDPNADKGNGVGLGQLTGPAIDELDRIAAGGQNGYRRGVTKDTYSRLRSDDSKQLFDRLDGSRSARKDIRSNVMTSAAYLRVMLDVYDNDSRQALSNYNGSGGAIQRAYPGKVAEAYADLFDSTMPSEIVS